MKVKALNSIKHDGKLHRAGEVIDVDKKTAAYLVEKSAAVEYFGNEKAVGLDGAALFEETEDFSTLKVDELKAVCSALGLPASGNKGDLVAAIEASLGVEDETIDLDKMDKEALIALAKEEEVIFPEGVDEEAMRNILVQALAE